MGHLESFMLANELGASASSPSGSSNCQHEVDACILSAFRVGEIRCGANSLVDLLRLIRTSNMASKMAIEVPRGTARRYTLKQATQHSGSPHIRMHSLRLDTFTCWQYHIVRL